MKISIYRQHMVLLVLRQSVNRVFQEYYFNLSQIQVYSGVEQLIFDLKCGQYLNNEFQEFNHQLFE